ncbi:putative invertase/pectin methylesterase inhibitor family protein [Heracleum sosnowskyi]|uniref:Invertase/pectin methylesterase inhibitor family protein n=1 Tax=Heracleum sosnowskyi TaxID=360622 RepID=A0AAD8JA39_9APIA|nr:putative invertase/pectin methylesterase inhibitor family protein [Heracleum sosnowskyi]
MEGTKPILCHAHLTYIVLYVFLFMFCLQITSTSSATASVPKADKDFVKTSCNVTTYPSVCKKALSPYAGYIKSSRLKLTYLALSLTLKAANASSTLISNQAKNKRLTEYEAEIMTDCVENIEESVDQLQQTLLAIAHLRGADKAFQLSNAQTWASAAITNENTCIDAFSEGDVSASVKKTVQNSLLGVTRLNSNALYLINHLY